VFHWKKKILVYFSSHNFKLPNLRTRTPSGGNRERQQRKQTTGYVFSEQEVTKLFQYLNTIRDYYSHKTQVQLTKQWTRDTQLVVLSPLVIIRAPAVKKFINSHNGKVCVYYKEAPYGNQQ